MTESLRHICGISGGKDSSALAVILRDDVPNMEYFFCDTGAELPETYEYLTRLEVVLGKPIERLNATAVRPLVRDVPWRAPIATDALVHQLHEDQAP
jgi:3'-phosphoadenosine 5'-phosphosulfate sulfotransferase (PAPS reductase)/FAD synthetase